MDTFLRILRLKNSINFISTLAFISIFIVLVSGSFLFMITKYEMFLEEYVDNNLAKTEIVTKDVLSALNKLNSSGYSKCDESTLYLMRTAQFKSEFIKDVGFTKDDTLLCTTGLGVLKEPFKEPSPQFTTKSGIDMWVNVPIKLFNFQNYATVAKKDNYNVVINSESVDLDVVEHVTSSLFVRIGNGDPIYHFGSKKLTPPTDNSYGVWSGDSGIYAFKCSDLSISCAMAYIPFSKILVREQGLILRASIIFLFASLMAALLLNNYLNKLIIFRKRFLRNINKARVRCYYQPIIDIKTGNIIGCEVLARWQDDNGKIVSPDRFIPVIRTSRKTREFTNIIIKKAFEELSEVIKDNQSFKISFNIFPVDFNSEAVCTFFSEYRRVYPELQINVEITEDELIEAPAIAENLNILRERGFQISIDDFGTGYSSLSYLQELAVDYIKIDRSFVKDLEIGTVKSKLIPHIVSIAETINAKIIIEGIENEEQVMYADSLDIECAQGFYYSKPLPLYEFSEFLKGS